jgi:hypothetical protein
MKSAKQIAVARAVDLLVAAGAAYEVHFEGVVYGKLPESVKTGKRKFKYKRGELTRYVLPFIEKLECGAVVNIPADKFDLLVLQGAATSHAAHKWGAGNYVSHMRREDNHLELLRIK